MLLVRVAGAGPGGLDVDDVAAAVLARRARRPSAAAGRARLRPCSSARLRTSGPGPARARRSRSRPSAPSAGRPGPPGSGRRRRPRRRPRSRWRGAPRGRAASRASASRLGSSTSPRVCRKALGSIAGTTTRRSTASPLMPGLSGPDLAQRLGPDRIVGHDRQHMMGRRLARAHAHGLPTATGRKTRAQGSSR